MMSNRVMNAIKRPWIIMLTIVGVLCLYPFFFLSHDMLEMPALHEIESMQAEIRGTRAEGPWFTVLLGDYRPVLSSLIPHHRDWLPADWQALGSIKIRCKDGRRITIELYETSQSEGAFSLHVDGTRRDRFVSNYFRGGNDNRIRTAIEDAFSHQAQKIFQDEKKVTIRAIYRFCRPCRSFGTSLGKCADPGIKW